MAQLRLDDGGVLGIVWRTAALRAAATGGCIPSSNVLLAFGAKGSPAVVMSIVFAGAPIVNAIVAFSIHPPAGGFANLRWQFVVGIMLAALGGALREHRARPPTPTGRSR